MSDWASVLYVAQDVPADTLLKIRREDMDEDKLIPFVVKSCLNICAGEHVCGESRDKLFLWLLGFVFEHPAVERAKTTMMNETLKNCSRCLLAYFEGRLQLRRSLLHFYHTDTVVEIAGLWRDFDIVRHKHVNTNVVTSIIDKQLFAGCSASEIIELIERLNIVEIPIEDLRVVYGVIIKCYCELDNLELRMPLKRFLSSIRSLRNLEIFHGLNVCVDEILRLRVHSSSYLSGINELKASCLLNTDAGSFLAYLEAEYDALTLLLDEGPRDAVLNRMFDLMKTTSNFDAASSRDHGEQQKLMNIIVELYLLILGDIGCANTVFYMEDNEQTDVLSLLEWCYEIKFDKCTALDQVKSEKAFALVKHLAEMLELKSSPIACDAFALSVGIFIASSPTNSSALLRFSTDISCERLKRAFSSVNRQFIADTSALIPKHRASSVVRYVKIIGQVGIFLAIRHAVYNFLGSCFVSKRLDIRGKAGVAGDESVGHTSLNKINRIGLIIPNSALDHDSSLLSLKYIRCNEVGSATEDSNPLLCWFCEAGMLICECSNGLGDAHESLLANLSKDLCTMAAFCSNVAILQTFVENRDLILDEEYYRKLRAALTNSRVLENTIVNLWCFLYTYLSARIIAYCNTQMVRFKLPMRKQSQFAGLKDYVLSNFSSTYKEHYGRLLKEFTGPINSGSAPNRSLIPTIITIERLKTDNVLFEQVLNSAATILSAQLSSAVGQCALRFLALLTITQSTHQIERTGLRLLYPRSSFLNTINSVVDTEVMKKLSNLEVQFLLPMLEIASCKMIGAIRCLHRLLKNFDGECIELYRVKYVEPRYFPLNHVLRTIWLLRAMLPLITLECRMRASSHHEGDENSLGSMQRFTKSVMSLVLYVLKSGPLCVQVSEERLVLADLEKWQEGFSVHNHFACFFALVESMMQYFLIELQRGISSNNSPNAATDYLLEVFTSNKNWLEMMLRWYKEGQKFVLTVLKKENKQKPIPNSITMLGANPFASVNPKEWYKHEVGGRLLGSCSQIQKAFECLRKLYGGKVPKDIGLPKEFATILAFGLIGVPASSPFAAGSSSTEHGSAVLAGDQISARLSNSAVLNSRIYDSTCPPSTDMYPVDNRRRMETDGVVSGAGITSRGWTSAMNGPDKYGYAVAKEQMERWKVSESLGAFDRSKSAASLPGPIAVAQKAHKTEPGKTSFKSFTPVEIARLRASAVSSTNKLLVDILDWDFFRLENCVGFNDSEKSPVPIKFANHKEFIEIYKPLVIEEMRASILNSYAETKLEGLPIVVDGCGTVDSYCTLRCRIARPKNPDPGGKISNARDVLRAKSGSMLRSPFRQYDVILMVPIQGISDTESPLEGLALKEAMVRIESAYVMCFVDRFERAQQGDNTTSYDSSYFHMKSSKSDTFHGHQHGRITGKQVKPESTWMCYAITSITSSIRELQALYYSVLSPIFEFIMDPSKFNGFGISGGTQPTNAMAPMRQRIREREAPAFLDSLCSNAQLNQSQSLAVKHSLTADFGLALLQGPPGTGKTKTILGIISAIIMEFENNGSSKKPKILICAPSNAAVDEIAVRVLMNGACVGSAGPKRHQAIRFGSQTKITRPEVLSISYDVMVQDIMAKGEALADETNTKSSSILNSKIAALSVCIDGYDNKDPTYTGDPTFNIRKALAERAKLRSDLRNLTKQCAVARDDYLSNHKADILKNTLLFFSTLSGSGSDTVAEVAPFTHLIVDEAAQAVELSTLIPLQHGIPNVILVGDTKQLPATVLSTVLKRFNYERSLFQRLEQCGVDIVMLDTQYRMRPEIAAFPNAHFYGNRLLNDQSVASRKNLKLYSSGLLEPFRFFDICGSEAPGRSNQSLINRSEAAFIIQLTMFMLHRFGKTVEAQSKGEISLQDISIVTPYKAQKQLLDSMAQQYASFFGRYGEKQLDVATIDSYQGRERPLIFFSCVRSLDTSNTTQVIHKSNGKQMKVHKPSIGFVSDVRRLNVAITRARDGLFIVGNSKSLSSNPTWAALIDHAAHSCSRAGPALVSIEKLRVHSSENRTDLSVPVIVESSLYKGLQRYF